MLVIPISSNLHQTFIELATSKRMVFMAGLPGVGKSLLLQQLALIAHGQGRKVHLLQWDVARGAFETGDNLAKYPEIDGVTHPVIRKATGLWARDTIRKWDKFHHDPRHLLIGEVPLIGSRLLELAQKMDDKAERVLSAENVTFVVPVPSWEVRAVIEKAREQTIANPNNEKETKDAPPNVLRDLWYEVNGVARRIGLTKAQHNAPYNPYIYGGVYAALLHHRHVQTLHIDQVLKPRGSVYDLNIISSELKAHPKDVARIVGKIEKKYTLAEVEAMVNDWDQLARPPDDVAHSAAPLVLPLPTELAEAAKGTVLSAEQHNALKAITQLPLDASSEVTRTAIATAVATLQKDHTAITVQQADKFNIYDNHFNVQRANEQQGTVYLVALLQAYANVLANLEQDNPLTVVELPLLRIGLETAVEEWL